MDQLLDIFRFVGTCITDYIAMMNSNWLTQTFMYVIVIGFVVSTILIIRK